MSHLTHLYIIPETIVTVNHLTTAKPRLPNQPLGWYSTQN